MPETSKFQTSDHVMAHKSHHMRFWCLSHMRPVKAQVPLRIRAVPPEILLLAYMLYRTRRKTLTNNQTSTFKDSCYRRQKSTKIPCDDSCRDNALFQASLSSTTSAPAVTFDMGSILIDVSSTSTRDDSDGVILEIY